MSRHTPRPTLVVVSDERFARTARRALADTVPGASGSPGGDLLVDLQWRARDAAWRANYPHLRRRIVVLDGSDVGIVCDADVDTDERRLVEIALALGARRSGVGTAVLLDVLAEADDVGRRVTLHADPAGRALAWYRRHGFVETARTDAHIRLERPIGA